MYIWQGTPGDKADVPATELPLTYRISPSSFPLQSCRSRMQKIIPFEKCATHCIESRQLWSGFESVEIRYVSGGSVAGRRLHHLAFLVICMNAMRYIGVKTNLDRALNVLSISRALIAIYSSIFKTSLSTILFTAHALWKQNFPMC